MLLLLSREQPFGFIFFERVARYLRVVEGVIRSFKVVQCIPVISINENQSLIAINIINDNQ